MSTPPNSNIPNPRSPRDEDDWIAILVALGVLGATAAWISIGRIPFLPFETVKADLPDIELPSETLSPSLLEEDSRRLDGDSRGNVEEDPQRDPSAAPNLITADEQPQETLDSEVPSPGDSSTQFRAGVDNETSLAPRQVNPPAAPPDVSIIVPEPRVPEEVASDAVPLQREPLTFPDVPDNYWAKPFIDDLTARGILNGLPDGSYAPDRPMTRAELAVQVAQAFEIEARQDAQTFSDIPDNYWAIETIDEAVTTGFMKGYPEGIFRPDQTVPRVQVLVAIATGLALPASPSPDTVLQAYQDQAEIPEWARGKVASAVEADLINIAADSEAQLRANEAATRAEVAVILHRSLVYLGKVDPIE